MLRGERSDDVTELRKCFSRYEDADKERCTSLRRTSFALRRNGISTMEQLCEMREFSPAELAAMRNIGEKSLLLIEEICQSYERDNASEKLNKTETEK